MAAKTLQYDALAGGSIKLPNFVVPFHFTNDRADEIRQMLRSIASTEYQRKLMHQSLPLHMRRRTMSYNSNRLPRKFRIIHRSQFSKSGVAEKKKRPSRKYRRKARNLLKEYERRSRKNVWLETHIWHAKRFHMVTKWNYKVPWTSCNKGYRACYRATARHCLVQDVSYEPCVELRGMENVLKDGLKRMCSERIGLTVAAKAYVSGTKVGSVWMYEDGAYPYRCLGKVKVLWRANEDGTKRTVWLFAHPSFYGKLVENIVKIFQLRDASRDDVDVGVVAEKSTFVRYRRYLTKRNGGVEMTELKDTLNRYRLTGPLAQAILRNTLKPYHPPDANHEPQNTDTWFTEWFLQAANRKTCNGQQSYWTKIKDVSSPGELSPGQVVGLVIQDPRLNRPRQRTKALPPVLPVPDGFCPEHTPVASASPLWDRSVRDRVTNDMKTTHELSKIRSTESLVPGKLCKSERLLQPVPILLLQNPGSQDPEYKRLGYGSGWEIIVPAGYGLPVWHSLIMWGAKPAGLKEQIMISIESGISGMDVPDSVLGEMESDSDYQAHVRRYFNRPNNRRINYTKLAIVSPFRCPWPQLTREWNATSPTGSIDSHPNFYVLRDKEMLQKVQLSLDRKFNIQAVGLESNALIPLVLSLKTRGNPGDRSIICLPKREDFRANQLKRTSHDNGPVYVEPCRADPQEGERKQLRTMHLRTLKRLRSRRVREKKARQRTSPGVLIRIAKADNRQLIEEQLKRMAELWLPGKPATIRNQCTRECFGYVTHSCFSLAEGKVTALGYVTSKGLQKLFKICTKGTFKVLVRGTKTRCYRFATIRVQME